MERLGKIAIASLIIGLGCLLLDLLFCLIALGNMESIGNTPEWQALVGGVIIAAGGFLGLSVILGVIYASIKTIKN